MKTLMLSLATVLTLTISSTASAWVVHAGPVTVAGRPAAVRRPVPVVRPVARPVAVPVARPVAVPVADRWLCRWWFTSGVNWRSRRSRTAAKRLAR